MDLSQINTNPIIKFSNIIIVYNVKKFLLYCLHILKAQTFNNFEAISINDGSCDNTLKILNQYKENNLRFIVITQGNQGQGTIKNEGIDLAKGKYILYIDLDDFIENNQ